MPSKKTTKKKAKRKSKNTSKKAKKPSKKTAKKKAKKKKASKAIGKKNKKGDVAATIGLMELIKGKKDGVSNAFGVHGCKTIQCKLCHRFLKDAEAMALHVADYHGTSIEEYMRLYPVDPVNIGQNTATLAEMVDALIFKATTGDWPPWFTQSTMIKLPDDPEEAGSPIQDAITLMQQARLLHLTQFASVSERNILTLEAASAKDPSLTAMLLTNVVYPELASLAKQLNEKVNAKAAAQRAGVKIEPTFFFFSQRGQETAEATLTIDGNVMGDKKARANLQRGASKVAGLLTGHLDTPFPPTQMENMAKLKEATEDAGGD